MLIETIRKECTGCTACSAVCPKQCIKIEFDQEGFYYPCIDHLKCIKCKKCEQVCHCLNTQEITVDKTSFYGFHKDENIREKSTSGGAFYALAEKILADKGNVYGAAFNYTSLLLEHKSTDEVGLLPLLKSKYSESYMGDIICKINNDLQNGRRVLFCGTPCQVSGLKKAINDPNGLLVTCDFICHGVPSAQLLKEHIRYLKPKEKITEINFRPKEYGWNQKILVIKTENKPFVIDHSYDSFYRGFIINNVFLRQSCYNCKFRETHYSDITIADFWGCKDYDSTINDNKGLSLIVTNNKRGYDLVDSIENFEIHNIDNKFSDYVYKKKDFSQALPLREQFYLYREKYGFEKAAGKTYMKGYKFKYLIHCLKKKLKKLFGGK